MFPLLFLFSVALTNNKCRINVGRIPHQIFDWLSFDEIGSKALSSYS